MSGIVSGIGRAFAAAQARWDNMAPPDHSDDDERTSQQPLGDAAVLVVYCAPFGVVSICGAYINAEFVDEAEFSRRRVDAWQAAVQREIDSDAADHAECLAFQAGLDGEAEFTRAVA